MNYLYGAFSPEQIKENAQYMHGQVHKLLLYKDEEFEEKIFDSDEDFNNYFENLLYRFGGLNELLGRPSYMVSLMSVLQAAYSYANSELYNYVKFRKLILDAHGYIKSMFEEV